MSITIRLQNLPWTANAEDIRRFFDTLVIPDGGVHIIGGEHGDAFIVFGSDEDARVAMTKDGGIIKDTKIKLLLSSRMEMQKVIDAAKQQALSSQNLLQTLAAASQFDPSTLQMNMLPNVLSMLPSLRTLPGMTPVLPTVASGVPNVTMPVPPNAPSQKPLSNDVEHSTAFDPVITTQTTLSNLNKERTTRDAAKNSQPIQVDSPDSARSRSRSRSKSRDRGRNYRDRYKRDRSRDRKQRRDRSRSRGRTKNTKSRSRSRDRYRKRSRSNERNKIRDQNKERDRDYNHRDRDRRRDKVDDVKSDPLVAKNYDDPFTKKVDEDNRIPQAAIPISENRINGTPAGNVGSTPVVNRENENVKSSVIANEVPKIQTEVRYNQVLPPVPTTNQPMANWWGTIMRPPMMGSWMAPVTQPLANISEQSKMDTDANNIKPATLLNVAYNMYPFGQAYPPNPSAMYPYGAAFSNPAMAGLPRLPNMQIPNTNLNLVSNGTRAKVDPNPVMKRNDPRNNDEENDMEYDKFGRVRKTHPNESYSTSNDRYNTNEEMENGKRPQRRPRYETGYENRAHGGGGISFDESCNEFLSDSDDTYPRKTAHRWNYNNYEEGRDTKKPYVPRYGYNANVTSSCVEVRNVSSSTNEADIKKFFSPIPVYDSCIKFTSGKYAGSRNVLIKFVNPAQKVQALQKSGFSMNGCKIFINDVPTSVWEAAENVKSEPIKAEEPYLKVDFIPKRARPEDITAAFTPPPLEVVVSSVKNRESFVAYLKFAKVEDVQTALEMKFKTHICVSRVKLDAIKEHDFDEGKKNAVDPYVNVDSDSELTEKERSPIRHRVDKYRIDRRAERKEQQPSEADPVKMTCVLLKNLPQEVTDKEIVDLFAIVNILPSQIHIMFSPNYKQTGESYCEFRTVGDAETALKLNNHVLRDKPVSVTIVAKDEVIQAIGIPTITPLLPYDAAQNERPAENQETEKSGSLENDKDLNSTKNKQVDQKQVSQNVNDKSDSFEGQQESLPLRKREMNASLSFSETQVAPVPQKYPEGTGPPGCVVGLSNVPYRANADDVLHFFDQFEVTLDNIMRRYNDRGRPTGDARVILKSPQEAQRAVNLLNDRHIMDRIISVSLVQF